MRNVIALVFIIWRIFVLKRPPHIDIGTHHPSRFSCVSNFEWKVYIHICIIVCPAEFGAHIFTSVEILIIVNCLENRNFPPALNHVKWVGAEIWFRIVSFVTINRIRFPLTMVVGWWWSLMKLRWCKLLIYLWIFDTRKIIFGPIPSLICECKMAFEPSEHNCYHFVVFNWIESKWMHHAVRSKWKNGRMIKKQEE